LMRWINNYSAILSTVSSIVKRTISIMIITHFCFD
jgi:hypothetical protein